MKKFRIFFSLSICLLSMQSMACLSAYQFKIFPVGICSGKVITVDVQVFRFDASGRKKNDPSDGMMMIPGWRLHSFIAEYNGQQQLIRKKAIDTLMINADSCLQLLQKAYTSAYQKILKLYKPIELFKPSYISYCDFQKDCRLLSFHDTQLIYQNKKYRLGILNNPAYYGFDKRYSLKQGAVGFFISSVRVYRAGTKTLLLTHLGTGHEVGMGWIVADWKTRSKKDEDVWIPKEEVPDIPFAHIARSVYQEPLLHHGFGFDVFILD